MYIGHISKMKEFWEEAIKLGFSTIAIWSINNKDHPMTEEQKKVREYILNNDSKLPQNTTSLSSTPVQKPLSISLAKLTISLSIHRKKKHKHR